MGAVTKIFRSPFVSGVVGSKRPTGIFKPQDTPIGKVLPKEMLGIAANMEPRQEAQTYTQPKPTKRKRPTKRLGTGNSILVDDDKFYGI